MACFHHGAVAESKGNGELQVNLLDNQTREKKLNERRTARDKISLLSKYSQVVFGTGAPSNLAFVSSRVFWTRASNSTFSTRPPRIGSKVAWSSFFATSISRLGEPDKLNQSLGEDGFEGGGNERVTHKEQGRDSMFLTIATLSSSLTNVLKQANPRRAQ